MRLGIMPGRLGLHSSSSVGWGSFSFPKHDANAHPCAVAGGAISVLGFSPLLALVVLVESKLVACIDV